MFISTKTLAPSHVHLLAMTLWSSALSVLSEPQTYFPPSKDFGAAFYYSFVQNVPKKTVLFRNSYYCSIYANLVSLPVLFVWGSARATRSKCSLYWTLARWMGAILEFKSERFRSHWLKEFKKIYVFMFCFFLSLFRPSSAQICWPEDWTRNEVHFCPSMCRRAGASRWRCAWFCLVDASREKRLQTPRRQHSKGNFKICTHPSSWCQCVSALCDITIG